MTRPVKAKPTTATAEVVKAARKAAGLTQVALANASGISPATVTAVELGSRLPSAATAAKIARACGISPAEILPDFPWMTPDRPARK